MSEQKTTDLIDQAWQESLDFSARYGWSKYSPEQIRAFKSYLVVTIEAQRKAQRSEINRLREIAECNDPGALGLRAGESHNARAGGQEN